jgi:hypothetical protein
MASITFGRKQEAPGGWLASFRAADAWAVASWEAAAAIPPGHRELAAAMRKAALGCGGCLVAAAEGREREQQLRGARQWLFEGRYALYLACRLSLVDARRYRALSGYLERALRETEGLRPPPR